ncbi:hypothetical protein, partial [Desulfurella sp.]|uniref:hypothetical protein n=1 Tax=Desulfurella sp. TaxID=1962857 RepID=UPI0025B7F4F4
MIIEANSTNSLKEFIDFPFLLYQKDKFWVPPLRFEEKKLFVPKNPFYKNAKIKLFLYKKDGKTLGRIAAIVNKWHNDYHKDKVGFFGFFECINDNEVAGALFDAASDYLKQNGLKSIRGPANPSLNHTCAVLYEGYFQEPVYMMPYNPKYYIELLENYGFKKAKDLYAFYLSVANKPDQKYIELSKKIAKKYNVTLRNLSKKHFERDLEILWDIYSKAWANNWGFVPPTKEEFFYLSNDMKNLVSSELVIIAEKDGVPCAYSAIIPDFNYVLKKAKGSITPLNLVSIISVLPKIDNYRLITLGIIPEYRKLGIDLLLYLKSFEVVEKRNGRGG